MEKIVCKDQKSSSSSSKITVTSSPASDRVLRPMCFVKQLDLQDCKYPSYIPTTTPRTNLAKELEKYSKPPPVEDQFEIMAAAVAANKYPTTPNKPIAPKPTCMAVVESPPERPNLLSRNGRPPNPYKSPCRYDTSPTQGAINLSTKTFPPYGSGFTKEQSLDLRTSSKNGANHGQKLKIEDAGSEKCSNYVSVEEQTEPVDFSTSQCNSQATVCLPLVATVVATVSGSNMNNPTNHCYTAAPYTPLQHQQLHMGQPYSCVPPSPSKPYSPSCQQMVHASAMDGPCNQQTKHIVQRYSPLPQQAVSPHQNSSIILTTHANSNLQYRQSSMLSEATKSEGSQQYSACSIRPIASPYDASTNLVSVSQAQNGHQNLMPRFVESTTPYIASSTLLIPAATLPSSKPIQRLSEVAKHQMKPGLMQLAPTTSVVEVNHTTRITTNIMPALTALQPSTIYVAEKQPLSIAPNYSSNVELQTVNYAISKPQSPCSLQKLTEMSPTMGHVINVKRESPAISSHSNSSSYQTQSPSPSQQYAPSVDRQKSPFGNEDLSPCSQQLSTNQSHVQEQQDSYNLPPSPTASELDSYSNHYSKDDYYQCSSNIKGRDGRELIQCPTIGCDGMGHVSGNYSTHRSLSGCPHADRSQLPLQQQELKCPTPGCDGSGHVTGNYSSHRSLSGCPRANKPKKLQKDERGEPEPLRCPVPGCDGSGHITGKFQSHRSASGCPLVNRHKLFRQPDQLDGDVNDVSSLSESVKTTMLPLKKVKPTYEDSIINLQLKATRNGIGFEDDEEMQVIEQDINELKENNSKVESEMAKLQNDIISMENQLRINEKENLCYDDRGRNLTEYYESLKNNVVNLLDHVRLSETSDERISFDNFDTYVAKLQSLCMDSYNSSEEKRSPIFKTVKQAFQEFVMPLQ
ncbi:ST18 (predicted) [Pycnogonum litorale]